LAVRFDSPEPVRTRWTVRTSEFIPNNVLFVFRGESKLLPRIRFVVPADQRFLSMANSPILIREQRYHQIKAVLARLRLDASARLVVLVDKDGQQIAVHGELGELDTTSLASLAAGNVAATGGMAKLIGEREFPTLSHEGERESIHISVIGRVLLLVVFDDRSSLGLVKLRSKQVSQELALTFAEIERDSQLSSTDGSLPFGEITDEEIDSLFSQT
jgi:predicted regulator of Ras-like GTPase activity (Roadblock/LC7/MglB family)